MTNFFRCIFLFDFCWKSDSPGGVARFCMDRQYRICGGCQTFFKITNLFVSLRCNVNTHPIMHRIVKEKIPQLVELCKKYRVVRMYLFGSAARGDDFDPEKSDFDFLVAISEELSPEDRGENTLDLMLALDDLFGREVDLLTEKQLKNPYLIKSIDEDKVLIYEAA